MTEQLKALTQAEIAQIHEIAFEAGRATSVVDGLTERAMALVQKLAGFDQTPVKLQFQFRYMAGYMAKKGKATAGLLEEAELMRNAAGYGSEPKEGQSVRTAEWDMAYGAARKWWHKVLKKAKVATSEARGGAREGAGRDPSEVTFKR